VAMPAAVVLSVSVMKVKPYFAVHGSC
jgi:hypothetical protein